MGTLCDCLESSEIEIAEIRNKSTYKTISQKTFENKNTSQDLCQKNWNNLLLNESSYIKFRTQRIQNYMKTTNPKNSSTLKDKTDSLKSYYTDLYKDSFTQNNSTNDYLSPIINFERLGQITFDLLNSVRTNPNEYIQNLLTNNNKTTNFKLNLSDLKPGNYIEWSNDLYNVGLKYIDKNKEKFINIEKVIEIQNNYLKNGLKKNISFNEYLVDGFSSPKDIICLLIKNNINNITKIISDNYFGGAVCVVPSRKFKFRAIFYFVKDI